MLGKKLGSRKAIAMPTLAYWIIAVIILIIILAGYVILKQKNISAWEFVENLFRFRG